MKHILNYIIVLVVFLIIDGIWLGFIAKDLYQSEIGHLLKENVNFIAALIFYLFFALAILFFIINPSIEKESIKYLIISSIFFGMICYATYDLTNLSTLKDWSLKVTIIDIVWGGTVTFFTSYISFYIIKLFN